MKYNKSSTSVHKRQKSLLMPKGFFKIIIAIMLMLVYVMGAAANTPVGPRVLYNSTETSNITVSQLLNTSGGSFTTLLLNVTNQNLRWKAYVGNVTGKLTLDDGINNTIFDWEQATITGNVYATRNSSVDWSSIACAERNIIYSEETDLSINTSKDDSINSTFQNTIHKTFYAANNLISNSTCPAIATYINDTAQTPDESASFQEILLQDAQNILIYTTVIENNLLGFDNSPYDFQMIVADDESTASQTPYYFYVELN